jgi:transposase InsO family protein
VLIADASRLAYGEVLVTNRQHDAVGLPRARGHLVCGRGVRIAQSMTTMARPTESGAGRRPVRETVSARRRALRPWLRYYNTRRPHTALQHRPPTSPLQDAPA